MKVSKSLQEVKILTRGDAYVTPLQHYHLEEVELHRETIKDFKNFGYDSVDQALKEMCENAECYVCRNSRGEIIFISGLWHYEDSDMPQMFMLLASNIRENTFCMSRMTDKILDFYHSIHPHLSMTISVKRESMLQWAAFIGFSPIELIHNESFVYFERCFLAINGGNDKLLRPAMH